MPSVQEDAGLKVGRWLLGAGLVVWLVMYVVLVSRAWISPFWVTDDAYVYISRGVQLEACFFQDCPALQHLDAQLQPCPDDPVLDHLRFITRANHLLVYSPLHSLLLAGLHRMGLTWEQAFLIVAATIVLLLGLAIARWLSVLWGNAPAGVALVLLAFHVFDRQGLHCGIPSTLALALAMVLWARLARFNGHAPVTLVLISILLVLAHPMGRLYALSAAALALLLWWRTGGTCSVRQAQRGRTTGRNVLVSVLGVGSIVGLAFLASALVDRPILALDYQPFPPGDKIGAWLLRNWKESLLIVLHWGNQHGWWFILALVPLGFVYAAEETKRRAVCTLLALSPLLLLGLVHVLPAFSGAVFSRVWIPLALVLTGALAGGLCHLAGVAFGAKRAAGDEESRTPTPLLRLLAFAACAGVIGHTLMVGGSRLLELRRQKDESFGLVYDEAQPECLLSASSPGDRVLYTDRLALLYYCCHGAYDRGAVLFPALAGTDDEKAWLGRPDLRFAVVNHPIEPAPPTRGSRIELSLLLALDVRLREPACVTRVRVFLDNGRHANRLKLLALTDAGERGDCVAHHDVPPHWVGWIDFDARLLGETRAFRLQLEQVGRTCHIAGLAFEDGPNRWPWRQQATLSLIPYHARLGVRSISFDARRLLPEPLRDSNVEVLHDGGSSVLLRLKGS